MKTRELVELLLANGWVQVRMKGSHRQFRHAVLPGTVTVSGKLNVDVPIGTLHAVLKQAGIRR